MGFTQTKDQSGVAVVQVMPGRELIVAVVGKQGGSDPANRVVQSLVVGGYNPMNGIVGRNENTGVQMGLCQNEEIYQRIGPAQADSRQRWLRAAIGEQKSQQTTPGGQYG